MAEVIGITAGISNLLKALGSSGVYLKGAFSASREAQEIASQVHTTEAILKSLRASLKTIHRSNEFYDNWSGSTKLVVRNVKVTIDELNRKLGSQRGTTRLNFWAKIKWPLTRDDTLMLQKQMEAYMQMLSMVQNAFMQGTIQSVQQSARNIDDIFTEIGTLPSASSPRSSVAWSVSSGSTIVPSDSASQIGRTEMAQPTPSPGERVGRGPDLSGPNLKSKENFVFGNVTLIVNPSDTYEDSRLPSGDRYYNAPPLTDEPYGGHGDGRPVANQSENLGCGEIRVTLSYDRCLIWLIFKPRGLEMYESRWFVKAKWSEPNVQQDMFLQPPTPQQYGQQQYRQQPGSQQHAQQGYQHQPGPPVPKPHLFSSRDGLNKVNLINVNPDVKENFVVPERVQLTFPGGDSKTRFLKAWGEQIRTGKAELERLEQEKVVKLRASRMVARPSYQSV